MVHFWLVQSAEGLRDLDRLLDETERDRLRDLDTDLDLDRDRETDLDLDLDLERDTEREGDREADLEFGLLSASSLAFGKGVTELDLELAVDGGEADLLLDALRLWLF